jgi:GH15 family glucan-1,4-alpha-glucosidase
MAMPREIVLGNGRLAIALDKEMHIRDFFYPYVGLENHVSGHQFRTGVWVDGDFSWIGPEWKIETKYMPETLVSRSRLKIPHIPGQDISLEVNDAVHSYRDAFLRKVSVQNLGKNSRRIRLFFNQDFHIYGDNVGDTVMYESNLEAIVHYKRKRYFLVNGKNSQGDGIYQFAAGHKETPSLEGTWRDAEDGVLSGNPIAQGSVDSTISFQAEVGPGEVEQVYYWIACGMSLNDVKNMDSAIQRIGIEQLLLETENYWSAWANKKELNLCVLPQEVTRAFKSSLLIMRTHVDNHGGIIASLDSDILQFNRDTYSYIWPRDGAIVASAFDMAGFQDVSRLFFQFCNKAITDRGFFNHKYTPDGSVGSSWLASVGPAGQTQLPIQEDETALVLYSLWKHFQKYRDVEFVKGVYQNLVVKATDFLLDYRDPETGLPKSSFDLWEEKMGTSTWTASTVYAALKAAASFSKVFFDRERQEALKIAAADMKKAILSNLYDEPGKRFLKAIYPDGSRDATLDASSAGVFLFGVLSPNDRMVEATMNAISRTLWIGTDVGGLARYENDGYYRSSRDMTGNPWFICTLWLARWKIARARSLDQLKEGMDMISWAINRAIPSGVMAEQIEPHTGAPVSVSPLAWSHAEFVLAICEYLRRYEELAYMKSSTS